MEIKIFLISTKSLVSTLTAQHDWNAVEARFLHDGPLCKRTRAEKGLIVVIDHRLDGAPKRFCFRVHRMTHATNRFDDACDVISFVQRWVIETSRKCLELDLGSNLFCLAHDRG